MVDFAHQLVDTLSVGRAFLQPQTQDFLFDNYRTSRYRDAAHIELPVGEAWLFDYGVVVFWGVAEEQRKQLLADLAGFIDTPSESVERESLHFQVNQPENLITRDVISLNDNEPLSRLAMSHALAQSAKLGVFETLAQELIESNSRIPQMLALKGKVLLKRRELAMLRGELFAAKSDIILNFNLLDTPEFIWEYPELESRYLMMSRYLDILPRVSILSKKLETIHELLDMLAAEQNHQHSSFLEWIIIILIAIEIVLFFWH